MQYWLFKSEPDEYSIDSLKAEKNSIGRWDGIRNYQARNLIRDKIKIGDGVLFYHSSCKNVGIAGFASVVSEPYPDPLQFDSESKYFDSKATQDKPRWVSIDIKYESHANSFLPLTTIKATPALDDMVLVKRSRLSIQPVSKDQWAFIVNATKTDL
ncbi:EVE domain-containing protein [Psychrosphaera sp.]|nr:EVE domain-containing protein [Psychrosphaera sp.]